MSPSEFARVGPAKTEGSTIPIKILGACAVLLLATMVYNSLSGWQAQSHGQRNALPAALPLQRRLGKSKFAKEDNPDSPDEVIVVAPGEAKRDGKGMGMGKGRGKGRGKGKGWGGLASLYRNQPAALANALRTPNATAAFLKKMALAANASKPKMAFTALRKPQLPAGAAPAQGGAAPAAVAAVAAASATPAAMHKNATAAKPS